MPRLRRGGRDYITQTQDDLRLLSAFVSALKSYLPQARSAIALNPKLAAQILEQIQQQTDEEEATVERLIGRLGDLETMLQRADAANETEQRLERLEQRVDALEQPAVVPIRGKVDNG
jgi:tRNA U34 5-methylaminomethyl-2-thiouridine-forming methyltransferase MnmC